MNKLNIEPLELERVTLSVTDTDEGICVTLSGIIDMREPSLEVLPYLLKVHDETLKNNIKKVTADFSNLTFMNSSGIKSVINWIMKLGDITEEKRYTMIIKHNPEITWQGSTILMMKQLFKNFIVVEVVTNE